MSAADAERFVKDLATNQGLADQVKAKASGLASFVEIGRTNGYDFNAEEIKAVIRGAARRELSDEQLDAVAGGTGEAVSVTAQAAVVGVSAVVVQSTSAQITQIVGANAVVQAVAQATVMTMVS